MRILRRLTIPALPLLLLVSGCGSDSSPVPPVVPTPSKAGHIFTWAGTGIQGRGALGQKPKSTQLYWPQDVAFDPQGNAIVLDWNNHRVLSLDVNGNFELLIGATFGDAEDGQANQIGLNHPTHVSFDPQGRLILTAWHNSLLKRMDLGTGYIATFCGNGQRNFYGEGVPADSAILDLPVCTLFDSQGRMVIADQANYCIRRIDLDGKIRTIAGTPRVPGFFGNDGPATAARFFLESGQNGNPSGKICLDANDNIYIADTNNHAVRKIDAVTGVISAFAGIGGTNSGGYSGDGGPATAARLREPRDLAIDSMGNLFIADTGNHCIRMVATDGTISAFAGTPTVYGLDQTDGKLATEARLTSPYGVAVGPDDNVWVIDTQNSIIRIVYR